MMIDEYYQRYVLRRPTKDPVMLEKKKEKQASYIAFLLLLLARSLLPLRRLAQAP